MLTPFPGKAFICGHLSEFSCGHLHSFAPLKNRSVWGHHVLCTGTVLGSPLFPNPRAHHSSSMSSQVVVVHEMNVCRHTCHFTYATCKFLKDGCAWGWLRDLTGDSREARTVNARFRRSRIHAGSMKIIENGRNMTRMALLGLKLGQNECQRSCEFNAHPPESPKPHKKIKMADFGPAGERPKNRIKDPISNSRSTA